MNRRQPIEPEPCREPVDVEPEPEPTTYHVLHNARALCGFPGVPRDWPDDHTWVRLELADVAANCDGCLMIAGLGKVHHEATPQEKLDRMRAASRRFYAAAVTSGVHALIEFTGLINEFIVRCARANEAGINFEDLNVHSGEHLEMPAYSLGYVNEKMGCIYGVRFAIVTPEEATALRDMRKRAPKPAPAPKRRQPVSAAP